MKQKKLSLLWKIQWQGQVEPSYVLGTLHSPCEEAFLHIRDWCAVLDECALFVSELSSDQFQTRQTLADLLSLPEGQKLSDLLPEKHYFKLRKIFLKASGLNLDQMQHLLPAIISEYVLQALLPSELPYSLDSYLHDYAQRKGKPIRNLETVAEQGRLLHRIPLAQQLRDLLNLGKNIKKHRRDLYKMVELYATGDHQALFKAAKKNLGGSRRILLYERNARMVKQIVEWSNEGQNFFCAIGAAHLAGQKGILRLLKLAGAKISPVHPAAIAS